MVFFQSKEKSIRRLFLPHKTGQKNNPNENNLNSIDKKLIETEFFSFVKITLTGNNTLKLLSRVED